MNPDIDAILKKALGPAELGYIVTLGISPKGLQTGYGYLKTGRNSLGRYSLVERFIEKPKEGLAKRLMREKRVYWNAGIFIFRADVFLGEAEKLMPKSNRLIKICHYFSINFSNCTSFHFCIYFQKSCNNRNS